MPSPANLTTHTGDILDDHADILVCPVNCQAGVMGKGLALEFARRWPELIAEHRYAVDQWGMRPGRPFITRYMNGGGILFPTKDHWRDPSRLEWIEQGLEYLVAKAGSGSFRHLIRPNGVHNGLTVATPALGCGLGGLSFDLVRPLIERVAAGLPDIQIRLYLPRKTV